MPGTDAAELVIPQLATSNKAFGHKCETIAGIAPFARRSGSSISGEFPARSGNKRLKNAMFRSAWISSACHQPSRRYCQRKRAEGKKYKAAVMRLVRRRSNVIYAMLTNREFHREPTSPPAAALSDRAPRPEPLIILMGTAPKAERAPSNQALRFCHVPVGM